MKFLLLLLVSLTLSPAIMAETSIDKCVASALDGARDSLAKTERLGMRKLYTAEKKLLINDDPLYNKTRKELSKLCRRLYIEAIDL